MKKLLFLAAAAACAFACKPAEEEVPVVDVTMSSFAFTAEKNAALKSDITVEKPSSAVSVVLPYGTEDEVLKSLIPTFTVTEGATVTVGEDEIESGVTALDFTYPVDFLVTVNEKSNALYTVTVKVGEPEAFVFAAKSAESDSISKGPYLAINPKTHQPYFGVISKTAESADKRPQVFRYDGAGIVKVCDVTNSIADQPTLGFAEDGTPYFACYDGSKFVNLYKIDGSGASVVGEEGKLYKPLTNAYYSTIGLLPLSATSVYIGYGLNANAGNLKKRTLNLAHFDGTGWTQELGIQGRNVSDYAYETISKTIGGIGYLFIFNQNAHSLSLYRFASDITTIFESIKFTKAPAEEGAEAQQAKVHLYGIDFDIASDGTPYFVVATEASSSVASGYSPAVYKYNLEENKAELVGGILTNIDVNESKYVSLALDANDVPYVAYRNAETGNVNYTYIGTKTKVWVEPITLSSDDADCIKIRFAEDGVGYISYESAADKDHRIALYKTR